MLLIFAMTCCTKAAARATSKTCNAGINKFWNDYCNSQTKVVPVYDKFGFCSNQKLLLYMSQTQTGALQDVQLYTNQNVEGNPNCEKSGAGYICEG
jgi:hypothetical protein